MKREFLIDRQGKTFVLYAGLLDAAHEKGLKSIKTQLLQVPTAENGNLAIFYAEVEMEDGRVFTGIADATPQNVGRQVAVHFIRMAETRAKARALRDAINVGTAALEELGDVDEHDATPPKYAPVARGEPSGGTDAFEQAFGPQPSRADAPTPISQARQPQRAAPGHPQPADAATQAQVRAIYLIGRDQHGMSDADVDQRSQSLFGVSPNELTKRQASHLITALKANGQASS